jgi:trehalose 6-phosphate synthase/phosphatase
LIGWTGEVSAKYDCTHEGKGHSPKKPSNGVANGQLDEDERAKLVPKTPAPQIDEHAKDVVCLSREDKRNLESKLQSMQPSPTGKKYEIVPIWTLEDSDGHPEGAVAETFETQGRYRKYAEQGIKSISSTKLIKVLWPLLHYVMWVESDGRQEIKWWNDYVKLNQKFARTIIDMYKPGDIGPLPRENRLT